MKKKIPSLLILLFVVIISINADARSVAARVRLTGEVRAGKAFQYAFGGRFLFRLVPHPHGWTIVINDERGTEDISRLTPPLHFTPNPREIEGWHFRNSDNTGPNNTGEKNVNAPGEIRGFIFSPQVGRTIDGPEAKRQPTAEEIEAIRRFGQGELTILDYALTDVETGKKAAFKWMEFEVVLRFTSDAPSLPAKQ